VFCVTTVRSSTHQEYFIEKLVSGALMMHRCVTLQHVCAYYAFHVLRSIDTCVNNNNILSMSHMNKILPWPFSGGIIVFALRCLMLCHFDEQFGCYVKNIIAIIKTFVGCFIVKCLNNKIMIYTESIHIYAGIYLF